MSKFICRTILVGNASDLNRNFLKITKTTFRLSQTVQKFTAIIHRAVVEARHRLQIKIKSPVCRGNNFVLILTHNPNIHRIIARDIQSLCAERQLNTFHAVFAYVEVNRNLLNLNIVAQQFLNVLDCVQALHAVKP